MPIYEFYSPQANKIYTFYARSIGLSDKVPACPDNPKFKMERMVSSFAVTGRAKEQQDTPADAMDNPKMEQAMAEMERDFGGMDEENPDPRKLAQMMRRMSSLTGERLPETMEEMMRRMEAGEDPEKLEEEYGDAMEDPMAGVEATPIADTQPGKSKPSQRARTLRDPTLYEMADYVA